MIEKTSETYNKFADEVLCELKEKCNQGKLTKLAYAEAKQRLKNKGCVKKTQPSLV